MKKLTSLVLATLALIFALSGCGSDDTADSGTTEADSSPSASSPSEAESPEESESEEAEEPEETESEEPETEPAQITISDFEFESPESVSPGQNIMVTNEDGVLHTVTADDGSFDATIEAGATVELEAPDEAGDFPFICTPHPYMKSTLVVS